MWFAGKEFVGELPRLQTIVDHGVTEPKTQSDLALAIDAFLRGYCSGRSRTHPYERTEIDGVWVMRDAPRRNPRDYRKEEWIACGVEPAAVDRTARQHTRGRYFICAVHGADESDQPLRAGLQTLGYRLLATEPFFMHRLKRIPRTPAPATIRQVRTRSSPTSSAKPPAPSRSRRSISAATPRFANTWRSTTAKIVGWVRSVAAGDAAWCSDMYVAPSHRRRGIGRRCSAKCSATTAPAATPSVLLSSHAGACFTRGRLRANRRPAHFCATKK